MQQKIGLQVRILSKYITRFMTSLKCEQTNITGPQGLILVYICQEKKDIYQRDIEKMFNIRRSSATGLITSLENKGYIIKESVENDARLKKLIPTQKAYEVVSVIEEHVTKLENTMLKGINDQEIETFEIILNKMINNLLEDSMHE